VKTRQILLFLAFTIAWAGLLLRGFYIKFGSDARLDRQSTKQYETKITLPALRGDIFDRSGKELAVSVPAHSLFADSFLIESQKTFAKKIAPLIKLSEKEIRKATANKKKRFVWLARRLTLQQKKAIEALNLQGVGFIEESKRVYPNGPLAAHVLGFVGSESQGLEGVEKQFNSVLKGDPRDLTVQRDARGRPLFVEASDFTKRHDGRSLNLTLDRDLQYYLERQLELAVMRHQAKGAFGIILDPENSGVMAMANYPSFDLNSAKSVSAELRKNRVVADIFEPGSTFKIFTVAAGLRDKKILPNSVFDCEDGQFQIGKHFIREADQKHKFKMLTVNEIIQKSSNIGTTKMAFRIGDERLFSALLDFGFGKASSTEFLGEVGGILSRPPWRKIRLSNISFGQGVAVNALQITNGYAAIANGGMLSEPFLVANEEDAGEPRIRSRRVLSKSQALALTYMLLGVTSAEGTGKSAQVKGYPVAGKTGTAQKPDLINGGYEKGAYISSFIGFLPAQNPKAVIFVAIDTPKGVYYASETAAPLFSKVAGYTMRKLGVPRVEVESEAISQFLSEAFQIKPSPSGEVAHLKAGTAGSAEQLVGSASKESKRTSDGAEVVPDLKGLSLREVAERVRSLSGSVNFYGSGQVTSQSPPAGESFARNTTLQVFFE